jgi:hypothetical protein
MHISAGVLDRNSTIGLHQYTLTHDFSHVKFVKFRILSKEVEWGDATYQLSVTINTCNTPRRY